MAYRHLSCYLIVSFLSCDSIMFLSCLIVSPSHYPKQIVFLSYVTYKHEARSMKFIIITLLLEGEHYLHLFVTYSSSRDYHFMKYDSTEHLFDSRFLCIFY